MGLTEWITRKGITGIKAREVGKYYIQIQRQNPNVTPGELRDFVIDYFLDKYDLHNPSFTLQALGLERLTNILVDQAQSVGCINAGANKKIEMRILEARVITEELEKLGVPQEVI